MTNFCSFCYLRHHYAEIKRNRKFSTCKRTFHRFSNSLCVPLGCSFALFCVSLVQLLVFPSNCQFRKNSGNRNHILNATSRIELEFLIHCIWTLKGAVAIVLASLVTERKNPKRLPQRLVPMDRRLVRKHLLVLSRARNRNTVDAMTPMYITRYSDKRYIVVFVELFFDSIEFVCL